MTTIIAERLHSISTLSEGNHPSIDQGACLLEAVSWVAGEPWSDQPACASPVLGAYGRTLNDLLPDDKRQRLVPLVPLIVGTASDGHDQERGLMAMDWLIRVYTPTWLRFAGLEEAAVKLESLPRQASWDDVEAAVPVVREARNEAVAAEAVAWDALRDGARVTAGAVAWNATWDAAGAAAAAAARTAARDAAGDTSWDAVAGDVAWSAARAAARVVAGDALRNAAWDALRVAAETALRPTVDLLQESAIDLFTRMVEVGRFDALELPASKRQVP